MEDALKELFLLLDSNNRILHRFLQPLYLKFYPPNRPLFTVFYALCAHFYPSKVFINGPHRIRYFLTPEICLKNKGEPKANKMSTLSTAASLLRSGPPYKKVKEH